VIVLSGVASGLVSRRSNCPRQEGRFRGVEDWIGVCGDCFLLDIMLAYLFLSDIVVRILAVCKSFICGSCMLKNCLNRILNCP
jgi:hypothetical protein